MNEEPFKLSAETIRQHSQAAIRIRRRKDILSSVVFLVLFGWFIAVTLWLFSAKDTLGMSLREALAFRWCYD